jgi:hypothetical protein
VLGLALTLALSSPAAAGLYAADSFEFGAFQLDAAPGMVVSGSQSLGSFETFAPQRIVEVTSAGAIGTSAQLILGPSDDGLLVSLAQAGDHVDVTWPLGSSPLNLAGSMLPGAEAGLACYVALSDGDVSLTITDTNAVSETVSLPQPLPASALTGWSWRDFPSVDFTSLDSISMRIAWAPGGSDYFIADCSYFFIPAGYESMYVVVTEPSTSGPSYPTSAVHVDVFLPPESVEPTDRVIPPDPIVPLQDLAVSLGSFSVGGMDAAATLEAVVPEVGPNTSIGFELSSAATLPAQAVVHVSLESSNGTAPELTGPLTTETLPGLGQTGSHFVLRYPAEFRQDGALVAFDEQIVRVAAADAGVVLGDASISNVTSTGFDVAFDIVGEPVGGGPLVQMTWIGSGALVPPAPALGPVTLLLLAGTLVASALWIQWRRCG